MGAGIWLDTVLHRLRDTAGDRAARLPDAAAMSTASETIKRLRAELMRLAEENIRLERALKLAGPKHPSNPADRPAGGGPTSIGGPHTQEENP